MEHRTIHHEGYEFCRKKHVKFFDRMLDGVPAAFGAQETNLMTVVYFCVGGLDLLGASDILNLRRDDLWSFVYSLQKRSPASGCAVAFFGNLSDVSLNSAASDHAHGCQTDASIASTYAALCVLLILKDDLRGVDRHGMAQFIKSLQSPDGSFHGVGPLHRTSELSAESSQARNESETDMRFVFCACAISYIINDWSGIDISKTIHFIWKSQTYEGGFAQCPGAECHGGSTYCAVAAAKLIYLATWQGMLSDRFVTTNSNFDALFGSPRGSACSVIRSRLVRWCVMRQSKGFTGRANKPEDSCYTFWLGATLKMIDAFEFVNEEHLEEFCLSAQDAIVGGFAKWPDTRSDPLHSYLCMAGLALTQKHQEVDTSIRDMFGFETTSPKMSTTPVKTSKDSAALKPVFPALNISCSVMSHCLAINRQNQSA